MTSPFAPTRRQFHARTAAWLALSLSLGLTACSRDDGTASAPATPAEPPIALDQALTVLAAEGRGAAVGSMMSAQPVYVLFDPQCPHCGHLWNAALPLHDRVRFVWLPVAFISPKSLPQGVALLQAADFTAAMTAHEASLLSGNGGTAASASLPDALRAAVEQNTRLLNRLGAESVPYLVARHRQSGAPVAMAGALDTAALATWLGLGG